MQANILVIQAHTHNSHKNLSESAKQNTLDEPTINASDLVP